MHLLPLNPLKTQILSKEWCLDTHGWYAEGFNNDFDISSLQNDETLIEKYKNTIFSKNAGLTKMG